MRGITPQMVVKHDNKNGVQATWVVKDGGDGQSVFAIYNEREVVQGVSRKTFYSLSQLRGPWSEVDKKDQDPRNWRIIDNPAYAEEQAYCSTQALRILEILNAGIDTKGALEQMFGGPVINFPDFVKRAEEAE